MRAGLEDHALPKHLVQPPVKDGFLHLEIRNAIPQQASDAIGLFEEGHRMSRTVQLLRGGEPRWPRADHGHAFAGAAQGWFRPNPSFLEGVLDDGLFDGLDGDGRFIDAQHARGLAGGGANAAREFRKVVGGVQRADGFFPSVAVNQVVPIGDDVVQGTARVAKGNAAIHAARRLRAQLLLGEVLINFLVIIHALFHGPARGRFASGFHESGSFTQATPPACVAF